MEFERKRYHHPYVNIAPLVDVVFLLLLFFMLSSHLVREPSIKIRLPASRTATADDGRTAVLHIAGDGSIVLEGDAVPLQDLQRRLEPVAQAKRPVRIRADRSVDVGLLVGVIDEIRLAGIERFGLQTRARQDRSGGTGQP